MKTCTIYRVDCPTNHKKLIREFWKRYASSGMEVRQYGTVQVAEGSGHRFV